MPGGKVRFWTAEEDALVGTMPDGELAQKLGRSVRSVAALSSVLGKQYWNPRHLALLGKLSDEEVARQTGRSLRAVKVRRARLRRPVKS
jgi:hypothetical protein